MAVNALNAWMDTYYTMVAVCVDLKTVYAARGANSALNAHHHCLPHTPDLNAL